MIEIGKNQELIKKLSNNNTLLDASLTQINISNQAKDGLIIELYFTLMYSKEYKSIKLVFKGITEYNFIYNSTHNFYDVTSYKFLVSTENEVYISLDPINEENEISLEDLDFILSKEVVGYEIQQLRVG